MITVHTESWGQLNWADVIVSAEPDRRSEREPWFWPTVADRAAYLGELHGNDRMSLLALRARMDGVSDHETVHYGEGKGGPRAGYCDLVVVGLGAYRSIGYKIYFRGLKRGGRG